ncbi:MAG TPA: alpha/beta fold hydrolase [Myxococcota bacterium]|jgi:hypothetical protein|nr:alpha/beta fold hydrolase [Myxococcota bacterium]
MARPVILLAHGAGLPSSSPWMQAWRTHLSALGEVETFDYPYMEGRRRAPDRLPVLVAAHRAALAEACARHPGAPAVLAGKSMGGRIGCHVALEDPTVRALVCLGYPLVGAARGDVRDQVLLALRTPVLFVQGTRDKLCPLDQLAAVRARMTALSALHVVDGGDHSLVATKARLRAAGLDQAQSDRAALEAVRAFLAALPAP